MVNLNASLLRLLIPLSICAISTQSNGQIAYKNVSRDSMNARFERLILTPEMSIYGFEGQLMADSLLRIDPTNAQIWQRKAMPHLKNGDFISWDKYISKAVQYDPERYLAYRGFCRAIFIKDYENALLDFEAIQKLKPSAPVYEMDHSMEFFRGMCYMELGQLDSARFFMEKSIKWQMDNKGAEWTHYVDLFYMGVIYYELNDISKAQYYVDASLKNYAQFPDAHYYKALILNKLEKNGEAMEHLAAIENAWKKRYRMNEDNEVYANYPKQIGQTEVDNLKAVLMGKH
jgi:tetratricopeptide (TPR) repeat protein